MAVEEIKDAGEAILSGSWGSIGAAIAVIAGGFYAMWKVLPAITSNLNATTNANNLQTNLLTQLRAERDEALQKLEQMRDKYAELFKALLDAQEKVMGLQAELKEAGAQVSRLREHVLDATQFIESQPAPLQPEGEQPHE